MKVAVIGAGISGLTAALRLQRNHQVIVLEAAEYVGGHTHTHDIEMDGRHVSVDSGFIVFNHPTYPNFTALLSELGVASQPTDMSFSVRCDRTGLEYAGSGLNGLLVISIVKKFVGVSKTFDELLSEGIETLLRATEKFDYSRGFRFSTYATTAVRRTLWRSLQTAQRDRDRMLFGDQLEIADQPQPRDAPPDDDGHGQQQRRALRRLLRRLSQRERFILSRRYGLDADGISQSLQSLARDLGVCKERVRQLEVRAKAKIRVLAEELNLVFDEVT